MSDFDLKITKGNSTHKDEIKYEHKSFGIINISRSHGGDRSFFGQDNDSDTSMSLQLSNCDVGQHLGRDWYHATGTLAKVQLSELQYVELITSKNSSVPCTILYDENVGHIEYKKPSDKTWDIDTSVINLEKFMNEVSQLEAEAKSILLKKGTMKKDDKLAVIAITKKIAKLVEDNMDNYQSLINNDIEKVKLNMQKEVESHVNKAYSKITTQINNQKLIK